MELARRGRKQRLGIEDEYWQLIVAGMGPVEAAGWSGSDERRGTGGGPNAVASRLCGGLSVSGRTPL
jgi:hypothetical protein